MYRVGSIQLAWFTTTTPAVAADALYSVGCGADPDQVQRNKVVSPQNPLIGLASGSADGARNEVHVQPGRVDLIGTPDMTLLPTAGPLPTLPLDQTLQHFLPVALRVTAMLDDCYRVAAIITMVQDFPTYDEGAAAIFSELGLKLDPMGLTDVMFQLNKRRSVPSGFELNRLFRIGMMERVVIAAGAQDPRTQQQSRVSATIPERAIMLDVNTVPTGATYTLEQAQQLFEEIFGEIARLAKAPTIVEGLYK